EVCAENKNNLHMNHSARKLFYRLRAEDEEDDAEVDLNEEQELERALSLVNRLLPANGAISKRDFKIVEDLGAGIWGVCENQKIKISKRCFDVGHRFLAS